MELSYEAWVMIAGVFYIIGAFFTCQYILKQEENKRLREQLKEARIEMWREKWARLM